MAQGPVTINIEFSDPVLTTYNGNYTLDEYNQFRNNTNNEYVIFQSGTIPNYYMLFDDTTPVVDIYARGDNKILYNVSEDQIGYYIGGNNNTLNCFTDTCDILTSSGYKNIKDLNIGDLVLTQDNREVPILDKVEFTSVEKPILYSYF